MSLLVNETTKKEREKIVKDAIAMSTLDADMPSEFTLNLMKEYIEGNMEFEDVKAAVFQEYLRK